VPHTALLDVGQVQFVFDFAIGLEQNFSIALSFLQTEFEAVILVEQHILEQRCGVICVNRAV